MQISMLKSVVYGRSFSSGRPTLNEKTVACITLQHTYFNSFTARVDDGVCEVVLTFTSVDKMLWCDHSNEISLEVLSCGVICSKKFYKTKFGIFVEFGFGHIWQ